ncbi:hypothetical protein HDV03_003429 [Kappamyces sp. JEL0829]|nr:hypothetical protein HDV03_003429 [Kappamyces sp. JEL0829]
MDWTATLSHIGSLVSGTADPPKAIVHQFQANVDLLCETMSTGGETAVVAACLEKMVDVLVKEEAKSVSALETGPCMELWLNQQVLGKLVLLSWEDACGAPREWRRLVLQATASLVSMMNLSMLYNSAIHEPINLLLVQERKIHIGNCLLEFIILEYQLALKILESLELLALFSGLDAGERPPIREDADGWQKKPSFPIFDHLIQLIHLEGDQGDYSRSAFESLARQCNKPEIENYIVATDFCSIVMSSLAGLFAQLPEVLPSLSPAAASSRHLSIKKMVFQADLKGFEELFGFVQNCLASPSDTIRHELLKQFDGFLLRQVLYSSLSSCSDFDGSTLTTLYYISRILDICTDPNLQICLVTFLLGPNTTAEESEDVLSARDILLSKLNSLSEEVVTGVLQILSTLLTVIPGRVVLPLLIEDTSADTFAPVPSDADADAVYDSHSRLIANYVGLLPKAAHSSNLDAYLSDAITSISLKSIAAVAPSSDGHGPKAPGNSSVALIKKDGLLNKLFSKLDGFFSHSMAINIALTGVFSQLASQPSPVLTAALFDDQLDGPCIYTSVYRLQQELDKLKSTIPNFEVRVMMARQKLLSDASGPLRTDEYNVEGEIAKNVICLEEFLKEIVSVLMMKNETQ